MSGLRYNEAVEALRGHEYPLLQDSVYLDHAGATPCSKSLMQAFATEMTSVLYGNPHSGSMSSQLSTARIEDIRLRLLTFFKADPTEYDLVFVSNATAGAKLVLEGLRSLPRGYACAYHQACHTSLIGLRGEARQSACLDDSAVQSWLDGKSPFVSTASETSATLFAHSAQSHMDGRRYPPSWSKSLKSQHRDPSSPIFTLLDASSLAATAQLDLSHPDFAADFVVLSLYKIFGFPDLGVLIVRQSAGVIWDNRGYFGGGTVDLVLCGKEHFHVTKSRFLHERLEDGTLPFHNIMAVDIALKTQTALFGSMDMISSHTSYLCHQMFHGLRQLQHGNGAPVCVMYTDLLDQQSTLGAGPLVSFNIRDSQGCFIGLAEFEKLAVLKGIHVRTGGLCSPAGIAATLDLQPWEMRRNLSAGFKCGEDAMASSTKPVGVIRASLGAMSTKSDVRLFVDFVKEFFAQEEPKAQPRPGLRNHALPSPTLQVKSITVYPIKSCGGFKIPPGVSWEVRVEGLAWDREWCLIHRGSGQALSQKRYPKMALLAPSLMLDQDTLRVTFCGRTLDIPTSTDSSLFDSSFRQMSSKVCGDTIDAQAYMSEDINDFFSSALGIPCVLARFPAGGRGSSSRCSKARMQKHQTAEKPRTHCPILPGMPSPPESDSDSERHSGKILLSNESPILLIHSTSVSALNEEIKHRGGLAVAESSFRANIVVEKRGASHRAYSEDFWRTMRIGGLGFELLGACQRCQMVCVDQETGERKQEPLSTLAKTRRLDGKIFFGVHMRRSGDVGPAMIRVGDEVFVDACES